MNPKIVCIGSSNTDMIIKTPHIPELGETILGGKYSTAPGGKGANQAVAAARAGGDVTFIARVGDDMLGQKAKEGFARDNINIEHVITDPTAPSGVALIFVDDDGHNIIGVASGANGNLSPQDIEERRDIIKQADIILMQLEVPIETIEKAVTIAAETGVRVILDPAPATALSQAILSKIDTLTPNESEAEILTGLSVKTPAQAEIAARKLLEMGIKTVIVTLGLQGALVVTSGYVEHVAGIKVDAVDSTAAGDTFAGALSVALAEGMELSKAVTFANKAAALSVTKLGAQPSVPTRDQINSF